ncbi:MAG TPA: methyltransferase domain-containing protein [Burkholderiales bacterium]|nr:methyltransferase domain-containing protein [Burkholderiales bacterium]
MTRFRLTPGAAAQWAGVLLAACFAAGGAPAQDWGDTPYVQTPKNVVDRMLEIAKVGPGDYVIDLGSGDGRMVITAAKERGARGFGVDLDRKLVALANRNAAKAGVANRAVFYQRDLHATDVSAASVMSIYLLPEVNLMIRGRLLSTLGPGTRIVSHDYGMGDWPPDYQTELAAPGKTVGIGERSKIFYWVVPGHAAGRWRWKLAADGKPVEFDLQIQQKFQVLEGTLAAGGRTGRIEKGRLEGEKIEFSAAVDAVRYEFSGRIFSHAIEGKVKLSRGAARELPWSATRVEIWDPRHAALTTEQALKEMN